METSLRRMTLYKPTSRYESGQLPSSDHWLKKPPCTDQTTNLELLLLRLTPD